MEERFSKENDPGRIGVEMMKSNSQNNQKEKQKKIGETLCGLSGKINNVIIEILRTNINCNFRDQMEFANIFLKEECNINHFWNDNYIRVCSQDGSSYSFDITNCLDMDIEEEESNFGILTKPHKLIQITMKNDFVMNFYYMEKQN